MSINPQISSFFPKFELKHSNAGEKIITYEKSKSANDLFEFIRFHPSIRASFNSMVKADFSLEKASSYLPNLLKQSEASLLYETKCSCGQMLERSHIYDLKKTKFPKPISCHNCKKVNNLNLNDYTLCYDVDLKDILKAFYLGNKSVFTIYPIKECFECRKQNVEDSTKKISMMCKECSKLAYLSMQVSWNEDLKELLKERQGHWLEWYVWRLLKDKYVSDVGILINTYVLHFNSSSSVIFCSC